MSFTYRWTTLIAAIAVLLGSASVSATTHIVNQVGTTFSPRDITIELGDTVQWVRSDGLHTVTEGTSGGLCDGCAFDSPLGAGTPMFSVVFDATFVADNPRAGGLYDYYCRPHFGQDMKGSVTVASSSVPTLSSWGLIAMMGLMVGAAALVYRRKFALG